MLKSINLSVSSMCGASCIYCPSKRGSAAKQKIMRFELAKKIVDEISSNEFKSNHQVVRIILGENGDAFFNSDLIEILRYIKHKLPDIIVGLFTNFEHFSKDKAKIILKEQLISTFDCNIDGSNEKNYFIVKGLDLAKVKKNIIDFLEMRTEFQNESRLCINVLTLTAYVNGVKQYLGFYPSRLKNKQLIIPKDDFPIIKRQWETLLDPDKDMILEISNMVFWAERETVNCTDLIYKNYVCPNMQRIRNEAFIASDGTWYACCLDSNYELALGNVLVDSIDNIYSSNTRKNLIDMLEKREFQKIGGPCKTVNCCQSINSKTVTSPNDLLKDVHSSSYSLIKKMKRRFVCY